MDRQAQVLPITHKLLIGATTIFMRQLKQNDLLNRFKPSSKIFYWPFQGGTSFVDLLCFCSVLCLLCFVHVCLYVLCGHLLGKGWPLGSRLWCLLWVCHFPIGILGQVWYLIVSIPDLCTITYFLHHQNIATCFIQQAWIVFKFCWDSYVLQYFEYCRYHSNNTNMEIIHGSFIKANRDNIWDSQTVPSGFMLFQGPVCLNIGTFTLKKVLLGLTIWF